MPKRGYRKEHPLLKCEHCDYTTRRPPFLVDHARVHTGERPFVCELCGKAFTQRSNLGQHMKIHGKGDRKQWHCDKCDFVSKWKSSLIIHERWHRGERPYKCKLCDKSFSQSTHCRSHIRESHGESRRFQCDRCSRCFKRQEHLDRHVAFHIQDKQFACDICGKKFIEPAGVRQHRRIHMGEEGKTYTCDRCPYKTFFRQCLVVHQRIHTDARPYACTSCPKKFRTTSTLKIHNRMVHMGLAGKIFKCDKCEFATANNQSLKLHNKRMHEGIKEQFVVRCKLCNRVYTTRSSYYGHRNKHHPDIWKAQPSGRPARLQKLDITDAMIPEVIKQGTIRCFSTGKKQHGKQAAAEKRSKRAKKKKVNYQDTGSDNEQIEKDDEVDAKNIVTKVLDPVTSMNRGPRGRRNPDDKYIGHVENKDELDSYMAIGSMLEIDCSKMKSTIADIKESTASSNKKPKRGSRKQTKVVKKSPKGKKSAKGKDDDDEIDKYMVILDPSSSIAREEQSTIQSKKHPSDESEHGSSTKKTKVSANYVNNNLRKKKRKNKKDVQTRSKRTCRKVKECSQVKPTSGSGFSHQTQVVVVNENAITGHEKLFSYDYHHSHEDLGSDDESIVADVINQADVEGIQGQTTESDTALLDDPVTSIKVEIDKLEQLTQVISGPGPVNAEPIDSQIKDESDDLDSLEVKLESDNDSTLEVKAEPTTDYNSAADSNPGCKLDEGKIVEVKSESDGSNLVEVKSEPSQDLSVTSVKFRSKSDDPKVIVPVSMADEVIIIDEDDEESVPNVIEIKPKPCSGNPDIDEVKAQTELDEVCVGQIGLESQLHDPDAMFQSTSLCPLTKSYRIPDMPGVTNSKLTPGEVKIQSESNGLSIPDTRSMIVSGTNADMVRLVFSEVLPTQLPESVDHQVGQSSEFLSRPPAEPINISPSSSALYSESAPAEEAKPPDDLLAGSNSSSSAEQAETTNHSAAGPSVMNEKSSAPGQENTLKTLSDSDHSQHTRLPASSEAKTLTEPSVSTNVAVLKVSPSQHESEPKNSNADKLPPTSEAICSISASSQPATPPSKPSNISVLCLAPSLSQKVVPHISSNTTTSKLQSLKEATPVKKPPSSNAARSNSSQGPPAKVRRVVMMPEKMMKKFLKPQAQLMKKAQVKEFSSLRDLATKYISTEPPPKSVIPVNVKPVKSDLSRAKFQPVVLDSSSLKPRPASFELITID